jgi:hypothetical protein
MIKWIIPLLVLTACGGDEIEKTPESYGEIMEYIPPVILPKEKRDTLNTRLKSICLPGVSQKFRKLKDEDPYVGVYEYLSLSLDSLVQRKLLLDDEYVGRTEWEQSFKGGVYYKHIVYHEIGNGGVIRTKCRDKSDFVAVLSSVIELEDDPDPNSWKQEYRWKNDSTLYEPKNELVGCHYHVKIDDKGYYFMMWTCAC